MSHPAGAATPETECANWQLKAFAIDEMVTLPSVASNLSRSARRAIKRIWSISTGNYDGTEMERHAQGRI